MVKKDVALPSFLDAVTLAERFFTFFCDKIDGIATIGRSGSRNISHMKLPCPSSFAEFSLITAKVITNFVYKSLSVISTGSFTCLLKDFQKAAAALIARITISSLFAGCSRFESEKPVVKLQS